MRAGLRWISQTIPFPAVQEPGWSKRVSRWSQLDGPSFALTDFCNFHRHNLSKPKLLILASPGASNSTDLKFRREGASSPSLFVHTLPNIRCSPALQVMEWTGPVLCLQNDPATMISGLQEALGLLDERYPVIWVLGVISRSTGQEIHCFELDKDGMSDLEIKSGSFALQATDQDLIHWLHNPGERFEGREFQVLAREGS